MRYIYMEQYEIYNLEIDVNSEFDGVNKISLVKNPAIQVNFVTFSEENKNKINYKLSEDKQIISTPILIPDQLIYRNQMPIGEHYVKFSSDTIELVVQKYFKDGNQLKFNVNHKDDINGMYMFESYIVNRERNINPPKEFNDLPDGTWMGSFKIENSDLWTSIKDGDFKGVSVEAFMGWVNTGVKMEDQSVEDDFDEWVTEFMKVYEDLKKIK